MSVEEHTITILVNNQPGVLSRVAGVFSSRGYNIRTLCVAETTDPAVSRITLTSRADSDFTDKIKKQLDKLVDVIEVLDYSGAGYIHRELMLVRVRSHRERIGEFLRTVEILGCRILSRHKDACVLEVTGDKEESAGVLACLEQFGILEANRTGYIALERPGALRDGS
ncbi:MAG: acetolactate synthase small subunit [Smithellaceae bacterium]|nr:acetolactate synthase small subunit [Smithellaceae bacterium]